MTEEEYRAEMAKQARIANLIALRRLCLESATISEVMPVHSITAEIKQLVFVA